MVKIPILRLGDTSKVSLVRVHTKDGSATSGEDYNPLSEGEGHYHSNRMMLRLRFDALKWMSKKKQ